MYVQFHRLKSYCNAVLPNRGQDGLPKRMRVGKTIRQRISSQCMKAALRDGSLPLVITGPDGTEVDDTMRELANALGIGMSHRSRYIFPNIVAPALTEAFGDEAKASEYAAAFADIFSSEDGKKKEKVPTETKPYDRGFVDQPLVLGEVEANAIVETIKVLEANGIAPKVMRELFEKRGAAKKAGPAVEAAIRNIAALKAHCGMDGALFGRMTTGSVVGRVDSCLYVAHALTVHPMQSVGDYFSVQDTLKDSLHIGDDAGAAHTNSVELCTGLFYEHWIFDVPQALVNFAGLGSAQITRMVGWLTRAIYGLEPAAKRGSTAPFGNVPFFMVEVGRRQPRTLMDAFETELPYADSARAIERLMAYQQQANLRSGAPVHFILESEPFLTQARETGLPLIELFSKGIENHVEPLIHGMISPKGEEAA